MRKLIIIFLLLFPASGMIFAQPDQVDFTSENWILDNAKVTDYMGRKCLEGSAFLKDVSFQNGVIEVDVAVTGARSYPGIVFRRQNENEYERVYIRPHLTPSFQNVVQYVASFNGIDSWQLYNGPGMTASASFPKNEWFHLKIEVKDKQAKVYINNSPGPSLVITDLAHGISAGSVGLNGPVDGTAYFSNFSCREDNTLTFAEPPVKDYPLGMIKEWEISQEYKMIDINSEQLPESQGIKDLKWRKIISLPSGLVDISRYYGRQGALPDCIWAKTTIASERDQKKQFAFGYSDLIYIFLNGELLFTGNSAYQSRDASFQGIVGLNDYINLPLKKGNNELLINVAESFGGWGFLFQDVNSVYEDQSLKKLWELPRKLRNPESVVYDPKRDVLYVSNYFNEGKEFISKINLKGEIVELEWVKGIFQPTGMCLCNDKLYVVGRAALVEVDPETGIISNRFKFVKPGFPNDVTCDENGNLYITDSQKKTIYRLSDGRMEDWLQSDEILNPNGILAGKEKLLVGVSGDGSIKTIDLATKKISTLVTIGGGSVMDGLRSDGKGNWLISDFNGRVFRITPDGKSTLLLNLKSPQKFCADFEYIPEKKLLIIPTLQENNLMVYEIVK